MKYRVKFKCYWYNTGCADNGYYINYEDFDKLEDAENFSKRIDNQFELFELDFNENYEKRMNWIKSENYVDIENGFISDKSEIVKYFPEYEEKIK